MKNLFKIIFLVQIIFISCKKDKENNDEIENQNKIETSSNKKSESIDETVSEPISEPVESLRIRNYAQMILDDKIQPSDDDETFECINQLFTENENDLDFYFEVFRIIVNKSDGALSEVVGQYVMGFLKFNPDYFISKYLEFDSEEKIQYVNQMAFEFYYVEGDYIEEINDYFEKVNNRLQSESGTETLKEMKRSVLQVTKRILEE